MRVSSAFISVAVCAIIIASKQSGYCQGSDQGHPASDNSSVPESSRLTLSTFVQSIQDLVAKEDWQASDIGDLEKLLVKVPNDAGVQDTVRVQLDTVVEHMRKQILEYEVTIEEEPRWVLVPRPSPTKRLSAESKASGFEWKDEQWQEIQWSEGLWRTDLLKSDAVEVAYYLFVTADQQTKTIRIALFSLIDNQVKKLLPTNSSPTFVRHTSSSPGTKLTISLRTPSLRTLFNDTSLSISRNGKDEFVAQHESRGISKSIKFHRAEIKEDADAKACMDFVSLLQTEEKLQAAKRMAFRFRDIQEHIQIRSAITAFDEVLRQQGKGSRLRTVRQAGRSVELSHYGTPNWISVTLKSDHVGQSLAALVATENRLELPLGLEISGRIVGRGKHEFKKILPGDLLSLQQFKNLRELKLEATQIDDEGLKDLHAIDQLERLQLSYSQIPDDALEQIPRHLSELSLSYTDITDKGLAHLDGMPNLRHLVLDGTNITDEGLRHLSSLRSLNILRVRSIGITHAGLAHVIDLPNLVLLSFGGRQKLSKADIEFLNEHGFFGQQSDFTKKRD